MQIAFVKLLGFWFLFSRRKSVFVCSRSLYLMISERKGFFFNLPLLFHFLFYFCLLQSVILGVVKIGGPWTRLWTRSTEGVHVLYFPVHLRALQKMRKPISFISPLWRRRRYIRYKNSHLRYHGFQFFTLSDKLVVQNSREQVDFEQQILALLLGHHSQLTCRA